MKYDPYPLQLPRPWTYPMTIQAPDPPRDYLAEALAIADGHSKLLAEDEHIKAVVAKHRETLAMLETIQRQIAEAKRV